MWGINEGQQRVVFSGIDLNDPPRNIRLCEARHEALLDGGELFNPDWLAKVREGSGIVRFMDWQRTNGNLSTLRFSNIPDENYCSYGDDSANTAHQGWATGDHHVGSGEQSAVASLGVHPACLRDQEADSDYKHHQRQSGHSHVARPQLGEWRKVLIYHVFGMTQLNQNVYTVAEL